MRRVVAISASLFLVFLCAGSAWGQSASATIYGVATDSQGAVVPDVKVTVTNVATNVESKTTTDGTGVIAS